MTASTVAPATGAAPRLARWLRTFVPRRPVYRRADLLRGAIGGVAGILVAAVVGRAVPGGPAALPIIVAPIGASAVLVFAAPASPLAQPWAVFGGNVTSSLVGIAVGRSVHDPAWAPALAVGGAILAMLLLGCLHPPGGACALFASFAAPAVRHHGFWFAVWPVGVNTLALLAIAVLVNNLTGRRYPHVPDVPPPAPEPAPRQKVGVQTEDVERAIARLDQGLDIMPADVVALLRDAELHALDRRLGSLTCEQLMVRDVQTVSPTESLYRARVLMNQHRVKALPVVDDDQRVVGIVTVYDLFNLDVADLAPVSSVMTSPVVTVRPDTPVADLVALMTDRDLRHVPVVDAGGRILGIVTRRELIAVMHQLLLH